MTQCFFSERNCFDWYRQAVSINDQCEGAPPERPAQRIPYNPQLWSRRHSLHQFEVVAPLLGLLRRDECSVAAHK